MNAQVCSCIFMNVVSLWLPFTPLFQAFPLEITLETVSYLVSNMSTFTQTPTHTHAYTHIYIAIIDYRVAHHLIYNQYTSLIVQYLRSIELNEFLSEKLYFHIRFNYIYIIHVLIVYIMLPI